jgi:hypothetical protein
MDWRCSMSTPLAHPPERYRAIIDAVSQRDREWFARHPGQTSFRRAYVPGETWPAHFEKVTEVEVLWVADWLRLRRPIVPCREGGER